MMKSENYLQSAKKQFEYYKLLGERTFEQLQEDELFWRSNEGNNSIGVIVNHLSGNMKSRWTDFLSTDGEKKWRNRDQEFDEIITSENELMRIWNEGWDCLFSALDSINESNFDQEIYIRNQSHTIVTAINRQMMHYACHIGQIVFIGKMVKSDNWACLSIAKGKSKDFNEEKFSKGKHDGHFTDHLK